MQPGVRDPKTLTGTNAKHAQAILDYSEKYHDQLKPHQHYGQTLKADGVTPHIYWDQGFNDQYPDGIPTDAGAPHGGNTVA